MDSRPGMFMTIQTPSHVQVGLLHCHRHFIHPPVTVGASHPFAHMDAVIEINKIGQIVHTGPLQRLALPITRPDRVEHGRVRPNLRMTNHAGLGGRNPGKGGFFHACVTKSAIESEAGNMMLMTEGDGLLSHHILAREIGRSIPIGRQHTETHNCQRSKSTNPPCQGIAPSFKNL